MSDGVYDAGPITYRSAVVAVDVAAVPGTVTCTKQAGGGVTAGVNNVKVVAGNRYGRTTATAGNTAITTETTNLTVRAAFAAVVGATYYDIYVSTDVDPKWVGRITEAQRVSGIKITAVGVTGAGGIAGAVDVEAVGTGLQAATTAAVNTAYIIPNSPVKCSGFQYVNFDLIMSRSGDAAAPALIVVPYFENSVDGTYAAGTPVTVTFGGTAGNYQPLVQRIQVEARGNAGIAIVVQSISGTGASLDINATLS